MHQLELIDKKDREDGTPHQKRMRQIPPETGKFLAMILANAPKGNVLEIGTSAGYSTMWLSLASNKITTFELDTDKITMAKETFQIAGIMDRINLVEGDFRDSIQSFKQVSFCFLDAEKELYLQCYKLIRDNLTPGGIIAADNIISHRDDLKEFIAYVKQDTSVDSVIIPIGKGILLIRKS